MGLLTYENNAENEKIYLRMFALPLAECLLAHCV